MKETLKQTMTVLGFIVLILFLSSWLMNITKPTVKEPKIILPNDWKLMSKYDGDPSLLSAYIRNDSIILNFEGY